MSNFGLSVCFAGFGFGLSRPPRSGYGRPVRTRVYSFFSRDGEQGETHSKVELW